MRFGNFCCKILGMFRMDPVTSKKTATAVAEGCSALSRLSRYRTFFGSRLAWTFRSALGLVSTFAE